MAIKYFYSMDHSRCFQNHSSIKHSPLPSSSTVFREVRVLNEPALACVSQTKNAFYPCYNPAVETRSLSFSLLCTSQE